MNKANITPSTIYQMLLDEFPSTAFKPRAEQLYVFQQLSEYMHRLYILGDDTKKYCVIDAPTGVGKSMIAIAASKVAIRLNINEEVENFEALKGTFKNVQVILATEKKILQDQYDAEFSNTVFTLKGLDNYPCYFDHGKTCAESKCARTLPSAKEKDEGKAPPTYCSKSCGYDEAVDTSKISHIILTNSSKYVNMQKFLIPNGVYHEPKLVIYDEGHNVESLLDNEAALDLSSKVWERLGLRIEEFFPNINPYFVIPNLVEPLGALADRCKIMASAEIAKDPDHRNSKLIQAMERLVERIRDVVHNPEDFILDYSRSEDSPTFNFQIKSKFVHKAFRHIFEYPTIFLSATMLSKKGFQAMTGVSDDEMYYISVGTPFKKENRPMVNWWSVGAKPLNYANRFEEFPNTLDRIITILEKHKDERGIIHAQSYDNANRLYDALTKRGYGPRLIYPKAARDQKQALVDLMRNTTGVLISPSMTEGVDLKNDLCRFVILAKTPYLKTVDPVVNLRMKTLNDWYLYKTCSTVVQAQGRGVRNETDYAVTYFVDPEFGRLLGKARHLFPPWFLESWSTMPFGPC